MFCLLESHAWPLVTLSKTHQQKNVAGRHLKHLVLGSCAEHSSVKYMHGTTWAKKTAWQILNATFSSSHAALHGFASPHMLLHVLCHGHCLAMPLEPVHSSMVKQCFF